MRQHHRKCSVLICCFALECSNQHIEFFSSGFLVFFVFFFIFRSIIDGPRRCSFMEGISSYPWGILCVLICIISVSLLECFQ